MSYKILIMKTGSTVAPLLALGEDFPDWFIKESRRPAQNFLVCQVHQAEPLPALDDIDGIIITGSPAYLTDGEPWNGVAADYIRAAHAKAVPMLGICYGHQLIAWAFGGDVDFHPRGREIGSTKLTRSRASELDELLGDLPASFYVNASHKQSVLRLPEGAVRLASNEFDHNHGFRLGDRTWGLQFHPEFSRAITKVYIEDRQKEILSEGLDPNQLLADLVETPDSASLICRFAEIVERSCGG